ncbi:peptidoglycan/LPS O-acetylase OafA/YrhL [Arthrobacter sp. UYEF6]
MVRLVLASLVILGHAWPLTGNDAQPSMEFVSGIAVNAFFVASGYLIAGSRIRASFFRFLWRRALRIYPAFIVCLLVLATGFGPLAALIEGRAYQWDSAISYVFQNSLLRIQQRGIDGTLTAVPYEIAWNGSLWTLYFEFIAYVLLGLLLTGAWIQKRAAIIVPVAFVLVVLARFAALGPLDVSTSFYLSGLRLAGYFLAGAVLYFLASRIILRPSYTLLALVAYLGLWMVDGADLFGQLPLAYLVLSIGAIRYTGFATKHDVSYGVYIYAFPVQQTLVLLGTASWGIAANSVLTLVITFALAWASWTYLERPMLAFKDLGSVSRLGRFGKPPEFESPR